MARLWFRIHLLLVCCSLQATATEAVRNGFWQFDLGLANHDLAHERHSVFGPAAVLGLGRGRTYDQSWYSSSIKVYLGPYERGFDKRVLVDYEGFGITTQWFRTLDTYSVRKLTGTMAYGIGLQLLRLDGKATDVLLSPEAADRLSPVDQYKLSADMVLLELHWTMGHWQPFRSAEASPENLKTRLEGFTFDLVFSVPVYARYRAEFRETSQGASVSSADSLKGHVFTVTLTSYLGT